MVTKRPKFARVALHNFRTQTHTNKHIIIVNETTTNVLKQPKSNELEIMITHNTKSLGQLRNIALSLVPPDAIWTTWDDDDWRSDDYLRVLYNKLLENKKKYLMFTTRIDHNLNTNFTYNVRIQSGTFIFFCMKDPYMQYDNKKTYEDLAIKEYILRKPNELVLFDNKDPKIYIRFIHTNNTSQFVNPNMSKIRKYNKESGIIEYETNEGDVKYVQHIIDKYYRNIL